MKNDLLLQSALCLSATLPTYFCVVRWKESDSRSVSGNIYEKWPSIRTLSHLCFCPGCRRSNQASGAWPREALNRGEERRNEQLQSVLQRRFQRVKQMFNQCSYRFQGSLRDKYGWKPPANRQDEWLDGTTKQEKKIWQALLLLNLCISIFIYFNKLTGKCEEFPVFLRQQFCLLFIATYELFSWGWQWVCVSAFVCVLKGGWSEGVLGEISLYYSQSWISLYILKYASVNNLLLQLRNQKQPMPRPDTPRWEQLHQPPPPTEIGKRLRIAQTYGDECLTLWGGGSQSAGCRVSFLVRRYWFPPSMLKGCFRPAFMRFSPSLSPNIIRPGLSTSLSIHRHALECFIYFTPRAGGGRDGRTERTQHHCFMTGVRRATQAVHGRCVCLYVLLPFRAARFVNSERHISRCINLFLFNFKNY